MNDNGSFCKVSIDGTNFPIREPTPFSSRWCSDKLHGAGLRYSQSQVIGRRVGRGDGPPLDWICHFGNTRFARMGGSTVL